MKRIRSIFAILLTIFMLTGCVGTNSQTDPFETDTAMPGYDAQNKYAMTTISSFQETDGFFCGSSFMDSYLQYYDKASGITGVLCADPACSHNSADCSAYIQSGATFSYYDGHFYWIASASQGGNDFFLWESDLSGANRKQVKSISLENIIMAYQPQRYVVHRGKLYMIGRSSSVTGAQVSNRISILSTSLDESEDVAVLYDNTIDRGVNMTTRFVGNSIYLSLVAFPEGGPFDVTIMKFDTKSSNSETVYEESGIDIALGSFWVTEQGEFYLPGVDETHAYVWKLENSERIQIASASWAGGYPSMPFIMDNAAVFFTQIDNMRYTRIIDLSGKTLYDGKLFPEAITGLQGDPNEYTFSVVGGDSDKLILNLQNFTGTGLIDHTIMLDVTDNMKPTIFWSSKG